MDSLASVKQFAQQFTRENKRLNVLILNAGLMNMNYAQTVDGLEQIMGVNHIAHAYLTQLLMPILIANGPSRIIVLSSALQSGPALNYQTSARWSGTEKDAGKGWGMMRAYQQSKLANILFAREIARRYKDKQITAYSVHPGVIKTKLR